MEFTQILFMQVYSFLNDPKSEFNFTIESKLKWKSLYEEF